MSGPPRKGKLVTPEEGKGCSAFLGQEVEQDFRAEKLLSGRRGGAGTTVSCSSVGITSEGRGAECGDLTRCGAEGGESDRDDALS